MIRIAILGDIGSGKSYVAKLFGYPVFNADFEVTNIYKKSKRCFKKLKKSLPKFIFSYPINKKEILIAITNDQNNLKKIIKIIHPEIRLKMNNFIKKNKNKKIIVLDIPLFLENKMNKKKDFLIFVEANKEKINKRLKKRPNFNLKILKILKKLQLPLELKRKKSDFVIKNNFKNIFVQKSVKNILKQIL